MPRPASHLAACGLLLAVAAAAQEPVGELFSSGASVHGAVVLTGKGTGVVSGSTVSAGRETAVLRLSRGGQVSICPGTTLNVTTSTNGRNLMLSLSTGAIETEYSLPASVDTLVTPDFRVQLTGPGLFRYAISADRGGNTCVRALPGNTAAVIVSELMGDGTYQVKHDEQVVFRGGVVADPGGDVPPDCGCPAAPLPVLRVNSTLPPRVADPAPPPLTTAEAKGEDGLARVPVRVAALAPAEVPASLRQPLYDRQPAFDNVYVQVDAPLIFRAEDAMPAAVDITAARLTFVRPSLALVPHPEPQLARAQTLVPMAAAQTPQPRRKRGFFSKLGSFFAGLFGGKKPRPAS